MKWQWAGMQGNKAMSMKRRYGWSGGAGRMRWQHERVNDWIGWSGPVCVWGLGGFREAEPRHPIPEAPVGSHASRHIILAGHHITPFLSISYSDGRWRLHFDASPLPPSLAFVHPYKHGMGPHFQKLHLTSQRVDGARNMGSQVNSLFLFLFTFSAHTPKFQIIES